jgi:hypothetical protein
LSYHRSSAAKLPFSSLLQALLVISENFVI